MKGDNIVLIFYCFLFNRNKSDIFMCNNCFYIFSRFQKIGIYLAIEKLLNLSGGVTEYLPNMLSDYQNHFHFEQIEFVIFQ